MNSPSIALPLLADSLTSRRLQLILMPTEACNFRCVYCYESFQYKRMEPWVVRGVKNLLSRRAHHLDALTLTWFGGEPLLAIDVIEDITRHARDQQRNNLALTIGSDITTNGWNLTRDVALRLLELGVTSYQISFDGPREWHDRKRVRPGGRATFDRIWSNVCGMRGIPSHFDVKVRLHVDRENVAVAPQFIEEFCGEFKDDPRFQLFIRPLGRFGGPNDATLPVFERHEGQSVVERLQTMARTLGARVTNKDAGPDICYAAKANSFLIRATGKINKCTLALDASANEVGSLREDGTMELLPERVRPWMRGLRTGIMEELACPMKGLVRTVVQERSPVIALAPSP